MEIITYAVMDPVNEDLTSTNKPSQFIYKSMVETEEQLPSTANIGEVYGVRQSGINYFWNGKGWDCLTGALIPNITATDDGKTLQARGSQWVKAVGGGGAGEGAFVIGSGLNSAIQVGNSGTAQGESSVAEGSSTYAIDRDTHAEGLGTTALGTASHVEGMDTFAQGIASHAEGYNTKVILPTKTTRAAGHAEGYQTYVYDVEGHAEGYRTTSFACGHAEGDSTIASGNAAHSQGYRTTAAGSHSFAAGEGTIATKRNQTVLGQYNVPDVTFDEENILCKFDFIASKGQSVFTLPEGYRIETMSTIYVNESQFLQDVTFDADTITLSVELNAGDHVEVNYYGIGPESLHNLLIVGNGDGISNRHNAMVLDERGNAKFSGDVVATTTAGRSVSLLDVVASAKESAVVPDLDYPTSIVSSIPEHQAIVHGENNIAIGNNSEINKSQDFDEFYLLRENDIIYNEITYISSSNNVYMAKCGSQEAPDILLISESDDAVTVNTNQESITLVGVYSNILRYATLEGTNDRAIPIFDDANTALNTFATLVNPSRNILLGMNNIVNGSNSITIGSNLINSGNSIVIGSGNEHDSNNLLEIGGFDTTQNRNVLTIAKDNTHNHLYTLTADGDVIATDSDGTKVSLLQTAANSSIPQPKYEEDDGKTLVYTTEEGMHWGEAGGGVGKVTEEGGEVFNNPNNEARKGAHAENGILPEALIRQGVPEETYFVHATGEDSHAEGGGTIASGMCAHAEGGGTNAYGQFSHAEGGGTAAGDNAHSEGGGTRAAGQSSHAEGSGTNATGAGSHAEGSGTNAMGVYSHAEGGGTIAKGEQSHAEGSGTNASGKYSHAEGSGVMTLGVGSHAEGGGTSATGNYSHAEGESTYAYEGHAEGSYTTAYGKYSHAEGQNTYAGETSAHAEGCDTYAYNSATHVEGTGTVTNVVNQHVQGKYNATDDYGTYAHIVGNGESNTSRSNAHTLDWDGNAWFAGDVKATDEDGLEISMRTLAATEEWTFVLDDGSEVVKKVRIGD